MPVSPGLNYPLTRWVSSLFNSYHLSVKGIHWPKPMFLQWNSTMLGCLPWDIRTFLWRTGLGSLIRLYKGGPESPGFQHWGLTSHSVLVCRPWVVPHHHPHLHPILCSGSTPIVFIRSCIFIAIIFSGSPLGPWLGKNWGYLILLLSPWLW